jgi:hypothetical protein
VQSELRWLYFETVNSYGNGLLNEIHGNHKTFFIPNC